MNDLELKNHLTNQNTKYDFAGQNYASMYPNLHKYPATMLPQIGLELLKDFKASKTNLLDPYCGSGSSFISGVEYGIKDFVGFDLNPLAIMISRAKLSFIDKNKLLKHKDNLLKKITTNIDELDFSPLLNITNLDFWIEKNAQNALLGIFTHIKNITDLNTQNLFILAFSETLREASFVRNNEFKLFRMRNFERYKPNVNEIFERKIETITQNYLNFYQAKMQNVSFALHNASFTKRGKKFDTILTSPPYGDSKTTVAYGQFSTFINEWLGFKEARKLDRELLGGKRAIKLYEKECMKDYINDIAQIDKKRAMEISSFYFDLEQSIKVLACCVSENAKVFFVVGNRTVKGITLPTDKFIAQTFVDNGFKHIATLQRKISNKAMPLKNSPTNQKGVLAQTMNDEFIIICEKKYKENIQNLSLNVS